VRSLSSRTSEDVIDPNLAKRGKERPEVLIGGKEKENTRIFETE